MIIIVTASELVDANAWEDFCEDKDINRWAINEGLMSPEEKFEISPQEFLKYGLSLASYN